MNFPDHRAYTIITVLVGMSLINWNWCVTFIIDLGKFHWAILPQMYCGCTAVSPAHMLQADELNVYVPIHKCFNNSVEYMLSTVYSYCSSSHRWVWVWNNSRKVLHSNLVLILTAALFLASTLIINPMIRYERTTYFLRVDWDTEIAKLITIG